jgi:deoxycytidine triphosphate deaminase
MQLTGLQIIKCGDLDPIVTNYTEKGIQQQGIDLRVKNIRKVNEKASGYIPVEGKSQIPPTEELPLYDDLTYVLAPGYYEVEFEEGCNIPNNATLHIKTRSSLVRCGAHCYSGQFDAGFTTANMGCFLHVILPISIDKGARIAQALVFESTPVNKENLYNGQWQGDKQREKK